MKKSVKVLLVVSLIIIGLLCVCLSFAYFSGKSPSYQATVTAKAELSLLIATTLTPEPTSTPGSTTSPEYTNTLKPTDTLEPTDTQEPTNTRTSTNTQEPTSTRTPTKTPTSSQNEEKLTYINNIQPLLLNTTDGMATLSQMSNLMAEDISLFYDADFKEIYFDVIDDIYFGMQEIVSFTPPTSLQKMHGYLTDAFLEFVSVRSLVKSGMNNFNLDDINAAAIHLDSFGNYLILATEALQ